MAGFTLLSPPSNLFAPGAVVLMTTDDNNHAQLKLVCGPRANLGASWMPRVSDTVSSSFKMSRVQRVELEAEAVDKFRSRTKVEDVQSVTVSFTNPKILEISEAEVIEAIDERSTACRLAIDARQDNGYRPTFVTSAYAADVEYTVAFKRDAQMTKSVKEKRMGQIAASLGGGHTEITEHSMKAVNLILAVRADEYLMCIKPNGERSTTPSDAVQRLNTPYAEAVQESDAPLVPPANGGWVSPIRSH
jgi:hypothetical protein